MSFLLNSDGKSSTNGPRRDICVENTVIKFLKYSVKFTEVRCERNENEENNGTICYSSFNGYELHSEMLSDDPTDPEWDNLVSSAVFVNDPVLCYFTTADGKFTYIKSELCSGWIPVSRDVNVGYLPLTSQNLLDQAFKSLGNRYGWGGSLNSQDCSSYIREVYSCFG